MTIVDDGAKMVVVLTRLQDDNQKDYFVGKLQFPGTIDFRDGISFMVFTSERGVEELQIGPIDERRQSKITNRQRGTKISNKVHVDLHALQDSHGNTFHLGEAKSPANIITKDGLFFTIFLSREGAEELQIGFLDHKRKPDKKARK
jgi:hypothetical protein